VADPARIEHFLIVVVRPYVCGRDDDDADDHPDDEDDDHADDDEDEGEEEDEDAEDLGDGV
jgi:hypothetical protein